MSYPQPRPTPSMVLPSHFWYSDISNMHMDVVQQEEDHQHLEEPRNPRYLHVAT